MAPVCIRCSGALGDDAPKGHLLQDCFRGWNPSKNSMYIWGAAGGTGSPEDAVGDHDECQKLLDRIADAKKKNGKLTKVTKWMAEKAWLKVYHNEGEPQPASSSRRPNPQTAQQPPETSTPLAIRGGPSSRGSTRNAPGMPSSRQGGKQSVASKAAWSEGSSSSAPVATQAPASTQAPATTQTPATTQSFVAASGKSSLGQMQPVNTLENLPPPANRPPNPRKPNRDIPHNMLGHPIRGGFSVATNYVSINRLPEKVYRYKITYGETYPVEGETAKPSKVSQKTVMNHILAAFKQGKAFQNSPHAHTYDTFWSTTPIRDTELRSQDVMFAKPSGRKFVVTFVQLEPYELHSELVIHKSGFGFKADAAKNLVCSPKTGKGGKLRTQSLNALFSHYAHNQGANVIPLGLNKIFLADGYVKENPREQKQWHQKQPQDEKNEQKKEDWLVMLRGYFTSIRPSQVGPLLNVNVATAAFFKPMLLSDLYHLAESSPYGNVKRLLKGLKVALQYHFKGASGSKASSYRVITEFGKTPNVQTFQKGEKQVTVKDHYHSLNYDIKCESLPCANIGSTDENSKVWVPLELLAVRPGQPFTRTLQGSHSQNMISSAVRLPAANELLIVSEGFGTLGMTVPDLLRQQTGMDVDQILLQIPATQIPLPQLTYRDRKGKWKQVDNLGSSWNLRNCAFFESNGSGKTIVFVDFCRGKFWSETSCQNTFGRLLENAAKDYGIGYKVDKDVELAFGKEVTEAELKLELQRYGQARTQRKEPLPHLLICLLPKGEQELYRKIKNVCDGELGVLTVCVTQAQFKDCKDGYELENKTRTNIGNLAMKINLKLGGRNHSVWDFEKGISQFEDIKNDTLVIGADVIHGVIQDTMNMPSIASLVGSVDGEVLQFAGSVRLQPCRQEIISALDEMVQELVIKWADAAQTFPKNILFYRDGVSESQFVDCVNEEIPSIQTGYQLARKALPNLDSKTAVNICFVVAGKRHHTRFYPTQEEGKYVDRNGNLRPGLLVNNIITRPDVGDGIYDFFLQSHAAIQGTARSAHYTVLSKGPFKPDQIQSLTHAFCFNFQRATKGVSYVAPAYYADILCTRAAIYLKQCYERMPDDARKELKMTKEEEALAKNLEAKRMHEKMRKRLVEIMEKRWVHHPEKDRRNPWHPRLDYIMFWL